MLPTKATFDEYVKKGLVRSQKYKDLTIYQYAEFTQFESLWSNCTLNARGIVFDDDGVLVQRCIPKFFNHDEPDGIKIEKLMLKEQIGVVQEKLDGSLIKITKDQKHGLVITSKASFESDQARMAKEIVDENNYNFKEGWTYHFELIHPDNQIVLNYGDKTKLKSRANEATIILKTAMICEARGIDEAMKYYNGTHSEDEYQEYRTSVILPD